MTTTTTTKIHPDNSVTHEEFLLAGALPRKACRSMDRTIGSFPERTP